MTTFDKSFQKAMKAVRKGKQGSNLRGYRLNQIEKRNALAMSKRPRDLSRVKKFDYISRWTQGHYNPHDNIVVRDKFGKHELSGSHGSSDYVSVFKNISGDRIFYYVLTENPRLPYIGLNEYMVTRGDKSKVDKDERYEPDDVVMPSAEVFAQEHETYEYLGKNWEDKSELWKVKALRDHMG